MYTAYWKLSERPFVNSNRSDFLYYSRKHEEAMVRLLYGIGESKGISLLVGDPGTGKTFISHLLRKNLLDRGFTVALLPQPDLAPDDLLSSIAEGFGIPVNGDPKGRVLHQIEQFALARRAAGSECVVILDNVCGIAEAATLQEISLLPDHEEDGLKLLHSILIGRTDFLVRLRTMRSLDQKIGIRYRLAPLDRDETELYLGHRLAKSGATEALFNDDAIDAVHRYSNGAPRAINSICDLALLAACGEGLEEVDEKSVLTAVTDYRGEDFLQDREPDEERTAGELAS